VWQFLLREERESVVRATSGMAIPERKPYRRDSGRKGGGGEEKNNHRGGGKDGRGRSASGVE